MGWDLGRKHFHGKEWHSYHLHLQNSSDTPAWLHLALTPCPAQAITAPGAQKSTSPVAVSCPAAAPCPCLCAIPLWAGAPEQLPRLQQCHRSICASTNITRARKLTIWPKGLLLSNNISKSSVSKLEMTVSKGSNLSRFAPPLTSGLAFARELHSASVLTFLWVWKVWWSKAKLHHRKNCTYLGKVFCLGQWFLGHRLSDRLYISHCSDLAPSRTERDHLTKGGII